MNVYLSDLSVFLMLLVEAAASSHQNQLKEHDGPCL